MRELDRKRTEDISEHMLVTQIICFFIFFLAVLSLTGIKTDSGFPFNWLSLTMMALFGMGIVLYIGKRIVSGLKLGGQTAFFDYLLFATLSLLSISIILITGKSESPVKMLFLIPVIIASTSYGKTYGMGTAAAFCVVLFVLDFTTNIGNDIGLMFQTDIVNCAVLMLLAWLIGGLADIEKGARDSLTFLANTDDLTGICNHRRFHESLREQMKSARASNKPLSLIMFDIDNFKFYNDNYGHQKGDEVLRKVGSILSDIVQTPNTPARYGGDEFVVIVQDTEEKALELAEAIRQQIESCSFEGADIQPRGKITVSLGVAGYPKRAHTPRELLRLADDAMYKAKYSKNKVQLYFSVLDELRDGIAESERDLFNSIKTLVSIINAKDRYTFGHSERVAYYALQLAERANLPKEEKVLLRYGSFLHDIGKIEIDRDLLNKVGPLKSNEFTILKKHPVWGSDMLHPITSLKKIIPTILYHHENFDGTGYPVGLSGEDIPIQARILRIADSFDAMTTDRPYKKAKTFFDACDDLIKHKGTLFDPCLVDHFIQLIYIENNKKPSSKEFRTAI